MDSQGYNGISDVSISATVDSRHTDADCSAFSILLKPFQDRSSLPDCRNLIQFNAADVKGAILERNHSDPLIHIPDMESALDVTVVEEAFHTLDWGKSSGSGLDR